MAIEGVKTIQASGYHVNQPAPKQVESASIDLANTEVSVDVASKLNVVKVLDDAESEKNYKNQKIGEGASEQIRLLIRKQRMLSRNFQQRKHLR